jgi:hypothetical protein
MKRFAIIIITLSLVLVFSGCSVVRGVLRRVVPHSTLVVAQTSVATTIEPAPTDEPEPSPSPETVTAEPTESAPETSTPSIHVYHSTAMGFTFTLPDSWVDKYRVKEGDGFLTVYFKPSSTIEEGMGNLFSIVKKTSEDDEGFLDNAVDVEVNGST